MVLCVLVVACSGSGAAPTSRLASAPGLDPGRAYRLVELPQTQDALSMILSVSGAEAYRVEFERSGTVTFQSGLVGSYWLNRDRKPSLNPYGGRPRELDAWRPSSRDAWTSDVRAADVRTLFEVEAAWAAGGILDVSCGDRPSHYVATNQVTRANPIAILLRGREAPIRLDCDGRADRVVAEATALLGRLVSSART